MKYGKCTIYPYVCIHVGGALCGDTVSGRYSVRIRETQGMSCTTLNPNICASTPLNSKSLTDSFTSHTSDQRFNDHINDDGHMVIVWRYIHSMR